VLLTADRAATRAIGRALGCTTGTVPKWRVRYARDRLTGFSEVGKRGPAAKYRVETDCHILALLDTNPPEGYVNWTGPLIARGARRHARATCLAFLARSQDRPVRPQIVLQKQRPRFVAKAAEIVGLEAGEVLLPERAAWLPELEAEFFAFPASRYYDHYGSISQTPLNGSPSLAAALASVDFDTLLETARTPRRPRW
jgi:hypothetical protein